MVQQFDEEQMQRYGVFRRTAIARPAVAKLVQRLIDASSTVSINQNILIVISGVAKVFVGEVVEEALDILEETEEQHENNASQQPLTPYHLVEALRRLHMRRGMPPISTEGHLDLT